MARNALLSPFDIDESPRNSASNILFGSDLGTVDQMEQFAV